jgi:hypothetical protein
MRRTRERVLHSQPTGATAEMRRQPAVDITRLLPRETHDDSGRAKATLRATRRDERCRYSFRFGVALQRRDRTTFHTRRGRHARDTRRAVDQYRATPTLSLRRASVLHRAQAHPLAQHVQQRFVGRGFDVDAAPVAGEPHRGRLRVRATAPPERGRLHDLGTAQSRKTYEKDCPQPHVRCALGLLIVNPASCRPSL